MIVATGTTIGTTFVGVGLFDSQTRRKKKYQRYSVACIKGRQLVNSVMVANEVLDDICCKKRRASLVKLDFEKAFDKVDWLYLKRVMITMGFGSRWIM